MKTSHVITEWDDLSEPELKQILFRLIDFLGVEVTKVTNTEWPEGHTDRERFVVRKEL